jgi:hypothetical protein
MPYLLMLLSLCVLVMVGCTSPRLEREYKDKPIGQSFEPRNFYRVDLMPRDVSRVLYLPPVVSEGSEFDPELSQVLLTALRRSGRFAVVDISSVELARILPHGFDFTVDQSVPEFLLTQASLSYGADAIMQVEISQYRPYKPISIGLRARLFRVRDGSVLWTIDETFDAGQESIAIGARRYSERYVEQAFPLQSSYSSLFSPRRFAAYVGHVTFDTLPDLVQ